MNWNWFGKTLKQRKQLNHNILTTLTTIIVVSMWWIWEHQQRSKENTSQLSKHNDNGFWWVCLKMLKKKMIKTLKIRSSVNRINDSYSNYSPI